MKDPNYPTLTFPDGDYQFVAPVVLQSGDIVRIHHTDTRHLSTTSEPVKYISSPIQTKDLIIVETSPDAEDHQIDLDKSVTILRRIPTLPTELGATIFIDELVGDLDEAPEDRIAHGTLAQYSKRDDTWNWFEQDVMIPCNAPSADILKWRPAYVTDKAPTV